MSFLNKELVNLHGTAKNADEAIVQAGELLVNAAYVSEQYVEKML
ncbi:PTS sugar transporter subunit IIA, partial [Listeria monocytogenes]|nr:PTS sugar transporter subunit IIA [Listeria monocytogenes]